MSDNREEDKRRSDKRKRDSRSSSPSSSSSYSSSSDSEDDRRYIKRRRIEREHNEPSSHSSSSTSERRTEVRRSENQSEKQPKDTTKRVYRGRGEMAYRTPPRLRSHSPDWEQFQYLWKLLSFHHPPYKLLLSWELSTLFAITSWYRCSSWFLIWRRSISVWNGNFIHVKPSRER